MASGGAAAWEQINMKTPVRDFLNEYSSSETVRFHMPGHKGKMENSSSDITEISGADSLYEASGIIAESEANASSIFGTAATFYSVEGSSQCIRAMLALVSKWENVSKNPVILAARNVHRSFLTAAALLDLDVEWLFPEGGGYSLCSCMVTPVKVKEKLDSMPVKPAAVYLTSPDYLGGMQDVKGIADAVHEYDIPLLVDNAHGAYLHFLSPKDHPMDLGADMCCDSAHKTLPSLTGCAYLHVSNRAGEKDIYINNARKALALFGSTSPSYILLGSLDETNAMLSGDWDEKLGSFCRLVFSCKEELKKQGWTLLDGGEPLKITVNTEAAGIKGSELAEYLRKNKIECEYADPDHVVLMPSPYNGEDELNKLVGVMSGFTDMIKETPHEDLTLPHPQKVMSIREAMLAPSVTVPADESAGRILAETALSCPPAVPVFVCGERIPDGAAKIFSHYGIDRVSVINE